MHEFYQNNTKIMNTKNTHGAYTELHNH